MKRSIQTIILDGGTNNAQKRELFKGSRIYKANYENNQLTLQFELMGGTVTEDRFFAVFDSRQAIPDKYQPMVASVSDQSVTLYIFDVTHERISFNEKEKDLVSFGNYILNKYAIDHGVTDSDLANWRNVKMGIMDIDDSPEQQ